MERDNRQLLQADVGKRAPRSDQHMPRTLIIVLAWLQLALSLLIAGGTLLGFDSLDTAIRDGSRSAAAALAGGAEAMEAASNAIEARRLLIEQARSGLEIAAKQIDQAEALAREQAKAAPQYVVGLRSAAGLLDKVADTAQVIATGMNVELPTGVIREGVKPVLTTSRPFAESSKRVSESAAQIKSVGITLSTIASSLGNGAKSLNDAIAQTSHEVRVMLDELHKSLNRVSSKEVPEALDNLKKTSANLRLLSATIGGIQNHGPWLLFGGLAVSLWFFLNSLTIIGLASGARRRTAAIDGAMT